MPDEQNQPVKSCMEEKLARLRAVYDRFGREGLREFPPCDIALLLSYKELALRDAPSGRDQNEEQKEANRRLGLEIRDLTGYLNAHFTQTSAHLPPSFQRLLGNQQNSRQQPPRQRDRGREYDR